ncbi:hypothetical protein COUCH_16430 [Couchioplanes caeruleus]|uniref:hypothetical protein n=1 Tax=Couchioplanes caeruleus TaxID=56438 RepID=UPI0020BD6D0A|nr:hypothetical protein [Couchioplanes caeruleus]UQU67761.1 hypothetical protein COUCH_16430 [Couchioplanes caeruleus]
MRLTGFPLILLAGGAAVGTVALTVRMWPRGGRWRPLTRTVTSVCAELLVVLTVGLVVNRYQSFYPSWQALSGGDTRQVTVGGPVMTGQEVPDFRTAAGRWHLRAAPRISVPADYPARPGVTFPLLVVLHAPADAQAVHAAAARTPDVVGVAVAPTAATSPADVRSLLDEVRRSVRVSDHGWAVVTDRPHRALADRIAGRDGTVVTTTGRAWPATLAAAAGELPPPLTAPLRP